MAVSKENFKLMMLRLQARALKKFNDGELNSCTAEFIMLNDPQYKNQFLKEFENCVQSFPVEQLTLEHIQMFIQGFSKKYFRQEISDIGPLAELMLEGLKTITTEQSETIGDELISAWTEAWDRHHRQYPDGQNDLNAQREFVMLVEAKKEEQKRR